MHFRLRATSTAAIMLGIFLTVWIPVQATAQDIIGRSVQQRPIRVTRISGTGSAGGNGAGDEKHLLVVGGIHGGYEWNSAYLAHRLVEHYNENPATLPSNITLHIVPIMNPDGLHLIAGVSEPSAIDPSALRLPREQLLPGRLNANEVDLNRNFDEEWQSPGYHGGREVGAGTAPFSEPETRAIRDYARRIDADALVFLHSASNNIWYGGLPDGWDPARTLAQAYSGASGYEIHSWSGEPMRFPITGTATGYFYQIGVPAITIELATRNEIGLERNVNGLNSLIEQLY